MNKFLKTRCAVYALHVQKNVSYTVATYVFFIFEI
jgi:hypothetical protein